MRGARKRFAKSGIQIGAELYGLFETFQPTVRKTGVQQDTKVIGQGCQLSRVMTPEECLTARVRDKRDL